MNLNSNHIAVRSTKRISTPLTPDNELIESGSQENEKTLHQTDRYLNKKTLREKLTFILIRISNIRSRILSSSNYYLIKNILILLFFLCFLSNFIAPFLPHSTIRTIIEIFSPWTLEYQINHNNYLSSIFISPFHFPQYSSPFYITSTHLSGIGIGHAFGEWLYALYLSYLLNITYVYTPFHGASASFNDLLGFGFDEMSVDSLLSTYSSVAIYDRIYYYDEGHRISINNTLLILNEEGRTKVRTDQVLLKRPDDKVITTELTDWISNICNQVSISDYNTRKNSRSSDLLIRYKNKTNLIHIDTPIYPVVSHIEDDESLIPFRYLNNHEIVHHHHMIPSHALNPNQTYQSATLFELHMIHVPEHSYACHPPLHLLLRQKYCYARVKYPFPVDLYKKDREDGKIIVAVHLRCGDACFNSFRAIAFQSISVTLLQIENEIINTGHTTGISYHLFTQPLLNSTHTQNVQHFEPLLDLPLVSRSSDITLHLYAHPHTAFHHLVSSDILVGGQSSFSWLTALLQPDGINLGPVPVCQMNIKSYNRDHGRFDSSEWKSIWNKWKNRERHQWGDIEVCRKMKRWDETE